MTKPTSENFSATETQRDYYFNYTNKREKLLPYVRDTSREMNEEPLIPKLNNPVEVEVAGLRCSYN